MHINAGQVDGVGVKRACGHDLFHLHDAYLATHCGGRVEVAGGLAEHGVAGRVGLPRLDDGEIGKDTPLKDVILPVEVLHFLALGDHGADTGLGVKTGNARAARAHPLGQRALGVKLQLQLAREILAHEFCVLAHVGGEHFLDLPRGQKLAQTEIIDARVVRCDGQILGACRDDPVDQKLGDAPQARP